MPDEARLILAFGLALAAAFAATPLAISVATRTGFNDKPIGYKGHTSPTPYLGGAAVVTAFILAGVTVGGELSRLSPIVALAFGMWCLGTYDDRRPLSPRLRLTVEFAAASTLWAFDLGWSAFDLPVVDLIATNLWVVGLMNAFNLMDNMDGAAATVGAVTTMTTAVLALVDGDVALAVLCAGMSGACLGFLPYNLSGPARIFLGDGGSLPVGFVVAATIMVLPDGGELGWTQILAAVILAGLPVVDTALVMISRRRAGIPLLTGGRDHMTHRLLSRLGSPRTVAVVLGAIQALLGAIAVGVVQIGEGLVVSTWATWFAASTVAILLLETATWAPVREPRDEPVPAHTETTPVSRRDGHPGGGRSPTVVEGSVIVFITAACGISPAFFGFYRVSIWGPIALFLLAALLALVLARPSAPRRTALVAVGGLVSLWLWSLLSTGWAESADQALLESNRWMLYASVFAILILLLRDDRLGKLLLASAAAVVVLFAGYLVVRLLGPDGATLFHVKRLNEPVGYVNGQAGYLLLGVWPLVALAERARSHVLSGAGISAATVLAGLAVLGQTRAIVPAAVVSAIVLVAVLPGRRARVWALVAIAAGVVLAAGPLLDVFNSGAAGAGGPDPSTLRAAVVWLLAAAVAVGGVWALLRWLGEGSSLGYGARPVARVSTIVLVGLVSAGVVASVVAVGNPVDNVREQASAFRNLGAESTAETRSRFTSGGGNRYDYWRIAWDQFADRPLRGIGAGNYDRTYFLERKTSEDIRQPHSLPLQTLGELGVVGGLGLLAFLGALAAGFARRARAARTSDSELGLTVAGGGMVLVWLVHTSVDWLHLLPGVTGIALCGAAVLVAPWARERGKRSPLRVVTIVVCAVAVVFGATLVGRSALADKYRSDSRDLAATDPAKALEKADDSLSLNDESLPAYYAKAAAEARLGRYEPARAALVEATRREPHDFVPWALLGDLAVRRGDLVQAMNDYNRSAELNPRDPVGLPELSALTPAPPD